MDKTSFGEPSDPSVREVREVHTVKIPAGSKTRNQSANDSARGSGGAKLFLNTPYLGHLGLHPGGFEGGHGLLRCSWAVKIHKAIACRERERERERRRKKVRH